MGANASNPGSYATPDDALARYDARLWGDLCGDVGVRYTAIQLKDASTLYGQRFLALLADASFEVEAACLRGGRYSADDLASLEGVARAGLIRLVTAKAVLFGLEGRNPLQATTDMHKRIEEQLQRLRLGEDVFGIQEDIDAGEGMETVRQTGQSTVPQPPISTLADRYFGRRSGREYVRRGTTRCW